MTPLWLTLAACQPSPQPAPEPRGAAPVVERQGPVLRRLTQTQLLNVLSDTFGDTLLLPTSLEPDTAAEGLLSVGAALASLSPRGVELYEEAAHAVAEQVMAEGALRGAWVPCTPSSTADAACAAEALDALGLALWRRPLAEDERTRLVDVAGLAADTLGDFHQGLGYALAAMLQSPYFLYRVELGEADPEAPERRRYTDWEMASRLSFLLWNSRPDAELLAAAAAGELTTDAGLAAQVERMLAADQAREGVAAFFDERFTLYALEDLNKDPTLFEHMSEEVGPAAREETLLGIEHLVFDEQGDYRDLLTTQTTFLNRKLASIYDVAAPAREGFGQTTLSANGGRRGLLGQVSVLAQHAHPVSTSVTRRGMFIREVLLCQEVPAPPAGLNTSIPEADADAPTMRDRLSTHLEDPTCASCHQITDPIGLGLENFDGLGRWRDQENGAHIDPSGELDGQSFLDAWTLAQEVRDHADLGACMVLTLSRYAYGHSPDEAETPLVDWYTAGFEESGYDVLFLMRDIAQSEAFRTVGEVQP